VGQSPPLISFSKVNTSKSKQDFLQRSHGYQNVEALKKNTRSLEEEDPAKPAPSPKDGCMECKQEA